MSPAWDPDDLSSCLDSSTYSRVTLRKSPPAPRASRLHLCLREVNQNLVSLKQSYGSAFLSIQALTQLQPLDSCLAVTWACRGVRRAGFRPPTPVGNSEEAQGGRQPCTHLSARSCWATAMAVRGPGERAMEGLTQPGPGRVLLSLPSSHVVSQLWSQGLLLGRPHPCFSRSALEESHPQALWS